MRRCWHVGFPARRATRVDPTIGAGVTNKGDDSVGYPTVKITFLLLATWRGLHSKMPQRRTSGGHFAMHFVRSAKCHIYGHRDSRAGPRNRANTARSSAWLTHFRRSLFPFPISTPAGDFGASAGTNRRRSHRRFRSGVQRPAAPVKSATRFDGDEWRSRSFTCEGVPKSALAYMVEPNFFSLLQRHRSRSLGRTFFGEKQTGQRRRCRCERGTVGAAKRRRSKCDWENNSCGRKTRCRNR